MISVGPICSVTKFISYLFTNLSNTLRNYYYQLPLYPTEAPEKKNVLLNRCNIQKLKHFSVRAI